MARMFIGCSLGVGLAVELGVRVAVGGREGEGLGIRVAAPSVEVARVGEGPAGVSNGGLQATSPNSTPHSSSQGKNLHWKNWNLEPLILMGSILSVFAPRRMKSG